MTKTAVTNRLQGGVVGLYSGERQLLRALAGHGVGVVAFEGDAENVNFLQGETPGASLRVATCLTQFMGSLGQSRTIVIGGSDTAGGGFKELSEQLNARDLVIDAGNCGFKECSRRASRLAERNIRYLDLGIIGGGSVLLAGGRPEIYQNALPILESMAATDAGELRISHLGPAAAGHFVKMVFDAIEYTLPKLGLEAFDVLKRALEVGDKELHPGNSARPLGPFGGQGRDEAARACSQAARELNTPIPTIDAAVGLRALSELEKQNDFASTPYRQPFGNWRNDADSVIDELRGALHAAIVIAYAQAVAMLSAASEHYGFDLDPAEIIRLWSGCCPQRAALLDQIAAAIWATPRLGNLLDDDDLSEMVMQHQEGLRHAVSRAAPLQTFVPTLLASLDYLDAHRGAWLPINLIQVMAAQPRPAALARR